MRALRKPSAREIDDFVLFVSHSRSWYKHLDLFGSRFLVFLDESPVDAAGKDSVSCALRFAWQPEEDMPFLQPNGTPVAAEPDYEERAAVLIYPYISEEIFWSVHADGLEELNEGRAHPDREAIRAAIKAEQALVLFIGATPRCYLKALEQEGRASDSRLIQRLSMLESALALANGELRQKARNRLKEHVTSLVAWIHSM